MRKLNKVLVIRFSSIGDIVLTSPVVRMLKKQLGCEVHFLCKAIYYPVVQANPYIDQLHLLENNYRQLVATLREEDFDLILDLHRNFRSARFKWTLGVPSRTFDKLNWEKWLLVRMHINRLPDKHLVDRYLDMLYPLGIVDDGDGLDYFIPVADEVDPKDFFTSGANLGADSFVAVVIGGAHATKRLPLEKLALICRGMSIPTLLLGGPTDAAIGEQVAKDAGDHVQNLCGKINLNQSASLIRQASIVISHDTGLMHIAAAFRKKIISIWGNTIPGFGMYPYLPSGKGESYIQEVEGLSCRPCSKIGFKSCPKGHFKCMTEQNERGIISIVQEAIQPSSDQD